jgi:hypothetical protein
MRKNDLMNQAKKRTNDTQARHRTKDSAWDDIEHLVRLYEKDRKENPDDYHYDPEEDDGATP